MMEILGIIKDAMILSFGFTVVILIGTFFYSKTKAGKRPTGNQGTR